jgi:tetratricopeptide (TPR) repeat protein
MTPTTRPAIAAMAVLVASVTGPVSAAPDAWIRLRTAHLVLVSNAGETGTRDVAGRLERFIDAFGSLGNIDVTPDAQVTVLVFRNDASFARFRPRQNGRTMNLSGYFQRADDENLIALSLESSADAHPYRVIFHEYAHALTTRAAVLWPLWLQEGLAEFCSTFDADDQFAELGLPVPEHVRLLDRERWLPLATLFAVDRASPLYTGDQQKMFYAEAWALVHYLIAGDHGRRRAGLARFADGLAAGQAPDRAFASAFDLNGDALEAALHQYIAGRQFVDESLTLKRPAPAVSAAFDALTSAEADVYQGSLLMRVGRRDEADAYFTRAQRTNPVTPHLEESLGFLALVRQRYDEALQHLRMAIEQDPQNHLAHYYYAEVLRRRVMEQGHPLSPDVARAMSGPLSEAIRLMPSFARAYYLLGCVHYVTGEDLEEGVRLLETAMRLAPPHRAAMLMLASIQLKMRDCAAAKATADAIVAAPDASAAMKAEARTVAEKAAAAGCRITRAGAIGDRREPT